MLEPLKISKINAALQLAYSGLTAHDLAELALDHDGMIVRKPSNDTWDTVYVVEGTQMTTQERALPRDLHVQIASMLVPDSVNLEDVMEIHVFSLGYEVSVRTDVVRYDTRERVEETLVGHLEFD